MKGWKRQRQRPKRLYRGYGHSSSTQNIQTSTPPTSSLYTHSTRVPFSFWKAYLSVLYVGIPAAFLPFTATHRLRLLSRNQGRVLLWSKRPVTFGLMKKTQGLYVSITYVTRFSYDSRRGTITIFSMRYTNAQRRHAVVWRRTFYRRRVGFRAEFYPRPST